MQIGFPVRAVSAGGNIVPIGRDGEGVNPSGSFIYPDRLAALPGEAKKPITIVSGNDIAPA